MFNRRYHINYYPLPVTRDLVGWRGDAKVTDYPAVSEGLMVK